MRMVAVGDPLSFPLVLREPEAREHGHNATSSLEKMVISLADIRC
jgi:hypothetical protein